MPFYLREWRDYAGLTQDQLVGRSKIAKSTINKLESTHTRQPRIGTVRNLAEALGISHHDLRTPPPGPGAATRPPLPSRREQVPPTARAHKTRAASSAPSSSADESSTQASLGAALLAKLVNSHQSGDQAEAIAFVTLVSLFSTRIAESYLRPEAYHGQVQAARQVLEHAEVLARAMFCESTANSITNDEMGVQPYPQERALAANAFARWRLVHGPLIQNWARATPDWDDDDLAHLILDWETLNARIGQLSGRTDTRPDAMPTGNPAHAEREDNACASRTGPPRG